MSRQQPQVFPRSAQHLGCLPPHPVRLIDRDREIAAVVERVLRPDVRLLTISGPGGVGKTALALAAAHDVRDRFPHGAGFVDLEPLRDPRALAAAIRNALGLPEPAGRTWEDALRDELRERELLLVLDTFEHVIEAAPEVSALLASCPSLMVITTSREPLGVRWEHEFPLAPLRLPCEHAPLTPEALADVPSVALFLERTQAIRPEFTIATDNAETIASICRRLDGLPLAIEMAAARMRTVSAVLLLAHIEQRSDLLGARVPDAPARHQMLGDLIGWSYALLSADEQTLLRRMAVFERGCNREAAEDLTGGDPCQFATLVEKSLAMAVDGAVGESRICLLETVRSFALELLRDQGEETAARQFHAAHMLRFVEEIAGRVKQPDARQADAEVYWIARLTAEDADVRSALRWLRDHGEDDRAERLQAALAAVAAVRMQCSGSGPGSGSSPGRNAARDPLTPREREIAMWIAKGLTSRRIAEALHISEKTVDCHADHIRTKLDLGLTGRDRRVGRRAWTPRALASGTTLPRIQAC
jgi:predicted ATPase/DNA-binding CsgD family transcriptional regulator